MTFIDSFSKYLDYLSIKLFFSTAGHAILILFVVLVFSFLLQI